MTTFARSPPSSRARPSSSPPGPSATPGPGSRSSAPRARRARSRRRSPTPPRCTASPGWRRRWRCTSRGTWSTTGPRCARYAEDLGVAPRHDQLQHLPGRRLQARRPDPHRRQDPPEGDRPPLRVPRRDGRDRLARPQDLARRGHQLPRARPTCAGRQDRLAGLAGDDLRAGRGGAAPGARVQVLRAGVLPHRRPGLGHVVRPGQRAGRAGRRSAWTPATTPRAPTSSSSSCSCCGWGSSARSTSTPASTPTTT